MDEPLVRRALRAVFLKEPKARCLMLDLEDHLLRQPYAQEREARISYRLGFELAHLAGTKEVNNLLALVYLKREEEHQPMSDVEREFSRSIYPTEWDRLNAE
jgi:hypothetical protein